MINFLCVLGNSNGRPYQDVKRSFKTALKKAVIEKCSECNYQREKQANNKLINCLHCGAKMVEHKGIKDFHFHDLRHTFASHLIMAGVDITTVSRLLGHKSLTMTLRSSHLAPSHMVKAVGVLDSTLNEKTISTKLAQFGR